MKSYKEYLEVQKQKEAKQLEDLFVSHLPDSEIKKLLEEGKWINGRFPKNIRIDQPTHLQGNGQKHAHVYGRNGDELYVINFDGTPSHKTTGKIHKKDAQALKKNNFTIPKNNILEIRLTTKISEDFKLLNDAVLEESVFQKIQSIGYWLP